MYPELEGYEETIELVAEPRSVYCLYILHQNGQ